MKGIEIIEAIQDLDDWMIEDAKSYQKRVPRWLEWGAVAVCIGCLIIFGGMCLQRLLHSDVSDVASPVAFASVPEEVPDGNVLGEYLPSIRIGNRVYFWRGLSLNYETQSVADRIEVPGSQLITVLPMGFEETNSIKRVNQQLPMQDYDMAADFEVTGIVFENPDCPEVIYARIKTDWIENLYVRFSTEKLGDRDRISYHGNLYQYLPGSNLLETLPEGYQNVGSLICVGADQLPVNDLETNHPVVGAAVYASDENSDMVYIETVRSWQGGTYVSYEECRILWRRITSGDESLIIMAPDQYAEHILIGAPFDYMFPVAEYNFAVHETVFALYTERNEDHHMDGMVWFIEAVPRYGDGEYIPSDSITALNYRLLGSDEEYSYLIWYPGLPAGECFDFWNLEDAEEYLQFAENSIPILESFIVDNGLVEYPGWQNSYEEATIQDARKRVEYLQKSEEKYNNTD